MNFGQYTPAGPVRVERCGCTARNAPDTENLGLGIWTGRCPSQTWTQVEGGHVGVPLTLGAGIWTLA